MKNKPSILFLCVANSARSQIAEGLAKSIFGNRARIESAGSKPSGKIHSGAITVLNEIGVDISSHTSKSFDSLDSDFLNHLDYLITLCAEEECPVLMSKAQKVHWGFPDPAAASGIDQLLAFRSIREGIKNKLLAFGKKEGLINV